MKLWDRTRPNIKVGDLVTHILYTKEWLGLVLEIDEQPEKKNYDGMALVMMIPGTSYESHFGARWTSKPSAPTRGWISLKWIRIVQKKC